MSPQAAQENFTTECRLTSSIFSGIYLLLNRTRILLRRFRSLSPPSLRLLIAIETPCTADSPILLASVQVRPLNEGKPKMATSEPPPIRVGTRRSGLALKQTEIVIGILSKAHPHLKFEVKVLSVAGDRDKTTPLPALGKGVWTNELEAQLATGELDLVVHSLKDMPTVLPDGCVLGAVTTREDARDVVVFKDPQKHRKLSDLPDGSIVGTSSVRRAAQRRRWYPKLAFKDVRGNIDTRLKKVETEDYDCVILAAAGLLRMGFDDRIGQFLDSETEGGGLLHAVGQGALGIEARKNDDRVLRLLQSAVDQPTMLATFAERSVMRTLEGGCSVPIGVETSWVDGDAEDDGEGEGPRKVKKLRLRAVVVSVDGTESVEAERTEEVMALLQADTFGQKVAQDLVDKGAQTILNRINQGREDNPAALKVGGS